jgi:hypothetical protein
MEKRVLKGPKFLLRFLQKHVPSRIQAELLNYEFYTFTKRLIKRKLYLRPPISIFLKFAAPHLNRLLIKILTSHSDNKDGKPTRIQYTLRVLIVSERGFQCVHKFSRKLFSETLNYSGFNSPKG